MNFKKSLLGIAIVAATGGASMSAQAALTSSATMSFNAGGAVCTSGGPVSTCAAGGTDIGGSYFTMDTNGSGDVQIGEKTPISMFAPIHLGTTQMSSGQHTGVPNGTESPAIDNPWNFFGNTGMHNLSSGVSLISDLGGGTMTLDFSGWGVNWGNYGPGGAAGPTIAMPGTATIVCSSLDCSGSSTYVLDMAVHVPVAFTSVPYTLHLEGHITDAPAEVPVPAAAWLFGSGLVGLVGVARRRRQS